VRADSLDMVSMLRTVCRRAPNVTARRPSDGRLQDQEDVWDEEEGRKEVAAANWASPQLGQGPGQLSGPGLSAVSGSVAYHRAAAVPGHASHCIPAGGLTSARLCWRLPGTRGARGATVPSGRVTQS